MSLPHEMRLKNGSRIVVIGAGPAGTLFAHCARQFAKEQALDVDIVLFDGKNFSRQGPIGCNMCAGVISGPLTRQLTALGITLPEERVQHKIAGYYLQTVAGGLALDHPDGEHTIRTVFRGNGPRFGDSAGNVSFDDFLLDHVKAEGISMLPFPVHELNLPHTPGEALTVVYGEQNARTSMAADLVVVACGLNSPLLERIRALGFGYRPPRSQRVCQAELPVGRAWIAHRLQNRVVVLTLRAGSVRLGVLTPKGEHLTVTLFGRHDLKLADLHAFLGHPAVRELLPPDWVLPESHCYCFPRLAVTASRRPFADRLVLIGDASFSRYYKNGIQSALLTARLAVHAAGV
jgi:2-polyprenyl-6-methoxyphenol hydroxylase-like FAD-dependent oxidoreductase